MMWMDMGNMGWGWGVLGFLHMGLWWILLILGIVVLLKWLFSGTRSPGEQALQILRERYARGDIGKDEFEQKRRDLSG